MKKISAFCNEIENRMKNLKVWVLKAAQSVHLSEAKALSPLLQQSSSSLKPLAFKLVLDCRGGTVASSLDSSTNGPVSNASARHCEYGENG